MTEKYALYRGETVNTISLWVRRDGKEYPIYSNTRGQTVWFDFEQDVYENTDPHALSDALVEWLAELHRRITGEGEMTPNLKMPEREWYETELLNAIGNPSVTEEQSKLMEWAYEKVDE